MGSAGVELRDVDVHSTVVAPVVGEGNDETNTVCLGGGDDVVEFAKTVATSVNGWSTVGPELVVCTEVLNTRGAVRLV